MDPLLLPPTVCRFNLFGIVKLDQESTANTICLSVGMVSRSRCQFHRFLEVCRSLPSPQVCPFTLEGPSWAWEEPLLVQCFACFLKAFNISCPDLGRWDHISVFVIHIKHSTASKGKKAEGWIYFTVNELVDELCHVCLTNRCKKSAVCWELC